MSTGTAVWGIVSALATLGFVVMLLIRRHRLRFAAPAAPAVPQEPDLRSLTPVQIEALARENGRLYVTAGRMFDKRPIETLTFGLEGGEDREKVAAGVLATLQRLGCQTGDDVRQVGCTTVIAKGGTIEEAKFLRMGLAGSGIGLTCFVPEQRYCLIHETIGGLQKGQVQQYVDVVPTISRELKPAERGHVAMVEKARRTRDEEKAVDLLTGNLPDEAASIVESALADAPEPDADFPRLGTPSWKCPDHAETNWKCRYCVAALLIENELEPSLIGVDWTASVFSHAEKAAVADIDTWSQGVKSERAELFVRIATFTRKLTITKKEPT